MTTFDADMSGDYVDYLDHSTRAPSQADLLRAAEQKTTADLEQQINALMARGADDRAQLVAMEQRHDALFTAVEALSKSPELTQFAQQLVAAVLVDHLKGWKS